MLDSDLKMPSKTICLVLASYTSKSQRTVFPSVSQIAADASADPRTVNRHLATLIEKGWLKKVARFDPGTGRQTSNEYTPAIPGRVAQSHPRGGHSAGVEGGTVPPEQTIRNRPEEYVRNSDENNDWPTDWTPEMWDVFTDWRRERATVVGATRGPKMKPTPRRGSKVRARLGDGYTAQDLKQAVRGCLSNPYNVEGGYLDIELICRDQAHVEQYLAWARNGNGAQPHSESGRGAIDAIERGGQNA